MDGEQKPTSSRVSAAFGGHKPSRITRLQVLVLALLFGSTVLNYIDRQTLSILARTVQNDLHLSDLDYAFVVEAFLLAYTLAYLVVGRITDRLGAKWSLALFVGWWSLANMATSFVGSRGGLASVRFALGLGEAGNYTAGPKAIAAHFQPERRAMAYGVYTAGAMVGATIAPPLIGWLALAFGWRAAFVSTGALGFVWLAAWLLLYREAPNNSPVASSDTRDEDPFSWGQALRDRSIWSLIVARMLTDPLWYFYLFWFPKYMTDERGVGLAFLASTAWIVYVAADFGSLIGGVASDRLMRSGHSAIAARLKVMRWAGIMIPIGGLIAFHPPLMATYAIAALVAFLQLCWQVNTGALIVERYPQRNIATIFGLIAAGAGIGGLASTQAVGLLVSSFSYQPVFMLLAAVHPLAIIALYVVGDWHKH